MSTLYEVVGHIAVIRLNNPPVNGLGHSTRTGVVEGVNRANADAAVKAIVLTGQGKAFCGGADIREFNTPASVAAPNLNEAISVLEASPKPVIAAIHGFALGGGNELAMGCHYRVASPGALIGLPEVKIGLLPGAGGTQRLPRLIGVQHALDVIVSGDPVKAEKMLTLGYLDQVIQGDLLAGATAFADEVLAKGSRTPKVRERPIDQNTMPGGVEAFFAQARETVAKASRGFLAPLKCLEAVEASVKKPFHEGLPFERQLFMELVQTTESKAQRHAFFAERTAAKIPDVADDTPLRPIKTAAVIGAGTMGGGIAMNFLNAGIPVTLLEAKQEALERGVATIRKNYEASAKKGRMTGEQVEQRMALLTPTMQYADVGAADIVIEAVFEDMAVKEAVFKQLDAVMKPSAILASNTSTLDVNKIASFTKRPQDVVGTHFFSPANVMRLLEVVRGSATASDVLATTMALAKPLRKVAVVSGVCDGFIGNRMVEQYGRQAAFLVEEGALPQEVDGALERWGMAMGMFRMSDLAGLDVGWYIRKRRYTEKPGMRYAKWLDKVCELGRYGQKTGAGIYRYETGRRDAIPDPIITELVTSYSATIGVKRRVIDEQEIIDRCILALVNEGAHLLGEGIALRASDIDVVYLSGYGFPVFRGGPMFYANTMGLDKVVARMKEFAGNEHADPGFWKPAHLLAELAAQGKNFK
jgi:3-hydroxyacyl-CoA dehydrogenase